MKKESFFAGSKSFYTHLVVMLLIMILFRFLPPFGQMTVDGMGVFGVFLGTLYGWIFLNNMGVASAVGMIMIGTTAAFGSPTEAIVATLGSQTVIMVIAAFALTAIMNDSGASIWLARRIVSLKFGKKYPTGLLILFMVAMFVIGPFTGFAGIILMWNMWRDVVRSANGSDTLLKFGIAASFLSGSCANQVLPFTTTIIVLDGVWESYTGLPAANFIPFFCYMTLIGLITCILFVLCGKYIFKVEMINTKNVDIPKEAPITYQKVVLVGLLAYFVLMIIASLGLGEVSAYLNGWGVIGLCTALLIIITMMQPREGKKTYHQYMSAAINWDIVLNAGVIFMFSQKLTGAEIGLSSTIESALGFMTTLGPVWFVLLITLIPLIATQFMSNMALATIFIPICYTFASSLGLNVYALNCSMYHVSSMALATPAGSAGAAIYYSYEENDNKTSLKYGWTIVACTFIATIFCYYVLGNLIFPMQ